MDLVPGPELAVRGEVAERPAPVLVDDIVPLADLGGALHLNTGDDTIRPAQTLSRRRSRSKMR